MKFFNTRPIEWTPSNITSLVSNPAWHEIEKRIQGELDKADALLENPEVFAHGMAIGTRRSLRLVLALPKMLRDEADGHSPVKALK